MLFSLLRDDVNGAYRGKLVGDENEWDLRLSKSCHKNLVQMIEIWPNDFKSTIGTIYVTIALKTTSEN